MNRRRVSLDNGRSNDLPHNNIPTAESQRKSHRPSAHSFLYSLGRLCLRTLSTRFNVVMLIGALTFILFMTTPATNMMTPRLQSSTSSLDFKPRMLQLTANNLYDHNNISMTWDLMYIANRTNIYWDDNNEAVKHHKPTINMTTRPSCRFLDKWQESYHPSCNLIHEVKLDSILKHNVRLVASGGFRDVFRIRDIDGYRVIKALRMDNRNFDHRNWDRHRRDALAFEQTSKSRYIVNIYAHCSNSAIFDYAGGGDLAHLFRHKRGEPPKIISSKRRLQIAYETAQSIADLHHFDDHGRPTIAHTDIKPDQWIQDDHGHFLLNDFNRVRFLMWDVERNEVCPFRVDLNRGIWRSPEEYAYRDQTQKGDVWSLGNILYFLASEGRYHASDSDDLIEQLVNSTLPPYMRSSPVQQSTDWRIQVILDAMKRCYTLDPSKRPEASEIAYTLKRASDQA